MFGGVEAELVAEVVIPVAGFAETAAPVAIKVVAAEVVVEVAGVAFEVVAPDVSVAREAVVEVVTDEAEEALFAAFVGAVCAGATDAGDGLAVFEAEIPTEDVVLEATVCVPTALEEFASASCTVMPVKDEPEPFAEAGTDVFAELATVFAGKAEPLGAE